MYTFMEVGVSIFLDRGTVLVEIVSSYPTWTGRLIVSCTKSLIEAQRGVLKKHLVVLHTYLTRYGANNLSPPWVLTTGLNRIDGG